MWPMGSRRGRLGQGDVTKINKGYVRAASHAGSWYTDDGEELIGELRDWLQSSGVEHSHKARAIIAPHAGYRYSGRCAAHAFAHIPTDRISRVFVLGPSHHYHSRRCLLSTAHSVHTPIGDLPLDTHTIAELRATGEFDDMLQAVDEEEHSLEMLLPYLALLFKHKCPAVQLVPILVGSLDGAAEERYGRLLSSYLADPSTFICVSSDFCHWGTRFHFTPFDRSHGAIHKSIEAMDRDGMAAVETGRPSAFSTYLQATRNTICGRHPIGVLLHMMEHCESELKVQFVRYEQSSQCKAMRDSSVSYAAAVITLT